MKKVFLQRVDGQLLGQEARLVNQYCIMERVPTNYFEFAEIPYLRDELSSSALVVGSVEAVSSIMEVLGIKVPEPDYYPDALNKFLHRSVWRGNKTDVLESIEHGRSVFVKSFNWKKLTGTVLHPDSDLSELLALSNEEPLWLGEPVVWLSEYRVYVMHHKIVAVCVYEGDESVPLDVGVVETAVALLAKHGAPASYAIDWGVLNSGYTAVVEKGDGWAMGAYRGISYREYFQFLKVRWDELLTEIAGS